jgi:hypothetical protein
MRVPRWTPSIGFVAQPTNQSLLDFKPQTKNRCSDFESQINKPELPVLRSKPGNPPSPWFWSWIKKPTADFEAKPRETVATNFDAKLEKTIAKPVKTVWVVLRSNHSQTVDLGFKAQLRNSRS